ncbi:cyclic-di-AMP-binding protein CbpB [Limosilactobacillus reuteri]|uniref:cyclic-di-AMP-binding protein CbpB n=1 Tax=Limosilactobacillus reuteri TaxID=1598 RepID=UPI001CDCA8C2|nr:cyclic-di-AMP-binding protein CbpB [Limosilactobacillus reuteri]
MIDQRLRTLLLKNKQKFMIPASLVATVNQSNSLDHAFLVLTKDRYAKIIVVDNKNHYCGQISLAMITDQLLETKRINVERLNELRVRDVMQTDAPVIQDPTDIEENLHLLIDCQHRFKIVRNHRFKNVLFHRFKCCFVCCSV